MMSATSFATGRRIRSKEDVYAELLEFLWDEAATLDRDDLASWRDLLADDLVYTMPVRVTKGRNEGDEFHAEMMHFDEDRASIGFRIKRLLDTRAWSEDPPSRVRRIVTGVQAFETEIRGEFDVSSSLLLVRTQDDDFRPDLVTGERHDRLRQRADGQIELAARRILLDQSTVGTPNLAIFL
jgi:3-phenylpropionate/cinnamic acid dioxygenase small subunit